MPIIEVKSVYKSYGDKVALEDVSFSVERGEMYCIVGPNGAGKTTLLEGILGLRIFNRGSVYIFGEEIRGRPPARLLKRIGYVLDRVEFEFKLTVLENLELVASLGGFRIEDARYKEALEAVGMWEYANTLYEKLSAGQQKKVLLAAAILHKPELLILDEPEANLDPAARIDLMNTISRLAREQDVTVVFSTHVLEIASAYADRVLILKRRVLAEGPPTEVAAKFGGKYKLMVKTSKRLDWEKEGDYYVTYASDVNELIRLAAGLEEVLEIHIKPPSLFEAFKTLTTEP